MTSCADVRENISAYADNELGIDERISFEEHIKNCPECKSELDEMIRIIGICSSIPLQPLPDGFKAGLHEKLIAVAARNNNAAKIDKPNRIPHARTFASIAAGILLIFLGGSIVRFGLLSGGPGGGKSFDSSSMTAKAPAEAPAQIDSEEGVNITFSESITADTKSAAGAAGATGAADAGAVGKESEGMDYGIMESTQSLAMPRSFEMNRSASFNGRDDAAAGESAVETAYSKSSEVTIMAEDPAAAVETITTLASINNGTVPGADELHTAYVIDTAENYDAAKNYDAAADGNEVRLQLQLVFAEDDYKMFTAALNDTFGAANIQTGAFVTEDRTDMLNMLIDRTNAYDYNIRELQNDADDNAEEINKLKKEKEEIDRQIEIIRLNSDFVTVTVYVNKK